MNFGDLLGHTLDGKYNIERELGRGGMGTVYLATHLGTERPVAVKVIAPQFMERTEFIERFRREARAAGRLRHPNVVNVTDFGFADTPDGRVAYLVMEYLDGCTLGEILEEESKLPVAWSLDILEQVCSAVQEAHEQGIIHRDLKPDNIWLEPNQRGGYTVKVLDFGIAKLEEGFAREAGEEAIHISSVPTYSGAARPTMSGNRDDATFAESPSTTHVQDASTVAIAPEHAGTPAKPVSAISTFAGLEEKTALFPAEPAVSGNQEAVKTKVYSASEQPQERTSTPVVHSLLDTSVSSDLTRVGSVLGTPLYMSPEQCRGERLDARSDIYSLGVIAYQMLSGRTPFSGDFQEVMEAHRSKPAPRLDAKNVRRKLKRVVESSLAKDPDDRPQTAEAFASKLRSRSEGIYMLLRNAAMIYSEHLPKFLILSAFFHLPMILLTISLIILSFLKVSGAISESVANLLMGIDAALLSLISAFCVYLIIGTISWIVSQLLAVPLRPVKIRASLREAKKKWRTFAGTGIMATAFTIISAGLIAGIALGVVAGGWAIARPAGYELTPGLIAGAALASALGAATFFVLSVLWMLVGPVVMMENVRGREALRRSRNLVKRSMLTSSAAFIIMFMIPLVAAGGVSFIVNVTAQAWGITKSDVKVEERTPTPTETVDGMPVMEQTEEKDGISINFGNTRRLRISNSDTDMRSRVQTTLLETLLQILLLPFQIVVTSFTAIIVALLYLKTRQAGGESMRDLLFKFEETDQPRKKWQERVKQRLIQSGRITSKSS